MNCGHTHSLLTTHANSTAAATPPVPVCYGSTPSTYPPRRSPSRALCSCLNRLRLVPVSSSTHEVSVGSPGASLFASGHRDVFTDRGHLSSMRSPSRVRVDG